jgi:hypothetical protein
VIHYQPGDLPAAQGVLASLDGAAILFADAQTPPATVLVDVGSVVSVGGAGSGPSTVASPTTIPTPDDQPISPSAAPLDFFDPRGC